MISFKKSKALKVSGRAKEIVKRTRNDPRFFFFLCISNPFIIPTPVVPFFAIPYLLSKSNGSLLNDMNIWIRIAVVFLASALAVIKILLEHKKFNRIIKKLNQSGDGQ